jgi:hypothetical protein
MLDADLSCAGLVLLTSQCWDKDLILKVHRKLALELPSSKTEYFSSAMSNSL